MKKSEETRRKLIQAVSEIIAAEGYDALGINKISKWALVPKPLIYRYFGDLDNLIMAYATERDFWANNQKNLETDEIFTDVQSLKNFISSILNKNYSYFSDSTDMQVIISRTITEKTKLLRDLSNKREGYKKEILAFTDTAFKHTKIDFRAITAILVASSYHLILHGKNNRSKFFGIDLTTMEGNEQILKAIDQIIEWAFLEIKDNNSI
jgi:AcrR family transcriptional regulator